MYKKIFNKKRTRIETEKIYIFFNPFGIANEKKLFDRYDLRVICGCFFFKREEIEKIIVVYSLKCLISLSCEHHTYFMCVRKAMHAYVFSDV